MTALDPATLPAPYQAIGYRRQGMLLVIEGVGGSGKSTIAQLLARQLDARVLHTAPEPIVTMQRYVNEHCRALPHLLYYLAGALHVSDLARAELEHGNVIIDRYVGSLLANHSAVQGTSLEEAEAVIAPFRHYLLNPDATLYLDATAKDVAERTGHRHAANPSAREPLTDARLIDSIRSGFIQLAERDTSGVVVDTHEREPREVAARAQMSLEVGR